MTLQQQLEYFWERGFYSVVKNEDGYFAIVVSLSYKESGVYRTWLNDSVDKCKSLVGNPNLTQYMRLDEPGWKIVDTIHPSELMGKGFQVGDLVKDPWSDRDGACRKVVSISETYGDVELAGYEGTFFRACGLKPVLPVEEEKITVTHKSHICGCRVWDCESRSSGAKWFFANGSDEWIELMPNVEYAICSKCMKKINQCDVDAAVKLLKEKGIIKDGHIVNL